METVKCPECQSDFSAELQSCPNCGCPVVEENNSTDNITTQYNEPERKKSSKKIIVIVSAIVILALCIVSVFCIVNSTMNTAKEEVIALNTKLVNSSWDNIKKSFDKAGTSPFDVSDDDIDTIINNIIDLQQQYNSLSDFQKQFISDEAQKSVDEFDDTIAAFKQIKEFKELQNQAYKSMVDKVLEQYNSQ